MNDNTPIQRNWFSAAMWALVALFFGAVYLAFMTQDSPDSQPRPKPQITLTHYEQLQQKSATLLNEWLESQRLGQSGARFWAEGSEPARFFAVRQWEILDPGPYTAIVRVDSSNQGGQPITNQWDVYLLGDPLKIWLVEKR